MFTYITPINSLFNNFEGRNRVGSDCDITLTPVDSVEYNNKEYRFRFKNPKNSNLIYSNSKNKNDILIVTIELIYEYDEEDHVEYYKNLPEVTGGQLKERLNKIKEEIKRIEIIENIFNNNDNFNYKGRHHKHYDTITLEFLNKQTNLYSFKPYTDDIIDNKEKFLLNHGISIKSDKNNIHYYYLRKNEVSVKYDIYMCKNIITNYKNILNSCIEELTKNPKYMNDKHFMFHDIISNYIQEVENIYECDVKYDKIFLFKDRNIQAYEAKYIKRCDCYILALSKPGGKNGGKWNCFHGYLNNADS